ncbi:unnamed protein product, partial [Mesorhabditis spiculigera]
MMYSPNPRPPPPAWRKFTVVLILFVINLLNYADRFTIAGVLTDIQQYYNIDNDMGGLLQTVFIVFFMLFSPVCGFLGDRYNRKWIMVAGILVWVLAVFASTFVPADKFWLFLLMRGIVGVGEASYAVVSPSLIGDLYSGKRRSQMLMLYYFAIPVGSGIGYVIGSQLSATFGSWEWGMRLTPAFGAFCIVLTCLFVYEPERGSAEPGEALLPKDPDAPKEPMGNQMLDYLHDLRMLMKNPTYIFSTFGYTALVFVTGTLSWWVPTAMSHAKAHELGLNSTDLLSDEYKLDINLKFGAVTIAGGIAGVCIGALLAEMLRQGQLCFRFFKTERACPIICAIGALIGTPALFSAMHVIGHSETESYALMFITITGLSFNWSINVDLLMSVVVPWRRNSSIAWQILISHLFGDAAGPYLIGMLSDRFRGAQTSPWSRFVSLRTAFYIPNAFCILSVLLFFIASMTVLRDQAVYRREMGANKMDNNIKLDEDDPMALFAAIAAEADAIEEDELPEEERPRWTDASQCLYRPPDTKKAKKRPTLQEAVRAVRLQLDKDGQQALIAKLDDPEASHEIDKWMAGFEDVRFTHNVAPFLRKRAAELAPDVEQHSIWHDLSGCIWNVAKFIVAEQVNFSDEDCGLVARELAAHRLAAARRQNDRFAQRYLASAPRIELPADDDAAEDEEQLLAVQWITDCTHRMRIQDLSAELGCSVEQAEEWLGRSQGTCSGRSSPLRTEEGDYDPSALVGYSDEEDEVEEHEDGLDVHGYPGRTPFGVTKQVTPAKSPEPAAVVAVVEQQSAVSPALAVVTKEVTLAKSPRPDPVDVVVAEQQPAPSVSPIIAVKSEPVDGDATAEPVEQFEAPPAPGPPIDIKPDIKHEIGEGRKKKKNMEKQPKQPHFSRRGRATPEIRQLLHAERDKWRVTFGDDGRYRVKLYTPRFGFDSGSLVYGDDQDQLSLLQDTGHTYYARIFGNQMREIFGDMRRKGGDKDRKAIGDAHGGPSVPQRKVYKFAGDSMTLTRVPVSYASAAHISRAQPTQPWHPAALAEEFATEAWSFERLDKVDAGHVTDEQQRKILVDGWRGTKRCNIRRTAIITDYQTLHFWNDDTLATVVNTVRGPRDFQLLLDGYRKANAKYHPHVPSAVVFVFNPATVFDLDGYNWEANKRPSEKRQERFEELTKMCLSLRTELLEQLDRAEREGHRMRVQRDQLRFFFTTIPEARHAVRVFEVFNDKLRDWAHRNSREYPELRVLDWAKYVKEEAYRANKQGDKRNKKQPANNPYPHGSIAAYYWAFKELYLEKVVKQPRRERNAQLDDD